MDVNQGTRMVDTGNCDSDVRFSAFNPEITQFVLGGVRIDAQVWDASKLQMIHRIPSATMLTSTLITGLTMVPAE